jgi:phosphoribosyl 1,2-cyclic phosphate phosphodiesterase
LNPRVTILGCGSSGGVPRVGSGWGACDPSNSKNRRRRCSILVEKEGEAGVTRLLVDTSPDLREQLLDADVKRLDAVLYTHQHADHTHGIDDLRPMVIAMRRRMPVYADEETEALLFLRFGYCFQTPAGGSYPPILEARRISAYGPFEVEGPGGAISVLPFAVTHGDIPSLGFRFDNLAYLPDVSSIPPLSASLMTDLDVLILDALRYTPHPTHFSVAEALEFIGKVKPLRAVLTNLHTDLDYEQLRASLPDSVSPAFDGMIVAGSRA